MLYQTLLRCVLAGCSILWAWRALACTDSPNGLLSGKLVNGYISIHFDDGMKWLSLALCCVLAVWLWRRGQPPARAVPAAYPGALPFIGNLHQCLGDELHMSKLWKDLSFYSLEKGGVMYVRVGVYPAYVITDPDDCLTVANTCFEKPYIYSFGKKWLGNGLVTADEKTWKLHRKLLNPAFSQKMLNMFEDVFNDQSRQLVAQLKDQVGRGSFDPEQYLFSSILEATCRATLNIKPEDNNMCCEDYTTATKNILDILLHRLQKFWLHPLFVFNLTSLKKKHDEYCELIADVVSTIIQNRKVELHEADAFNKTNDDGTGNCKTLLDLLLHLEQGALTDSDIMDHLNTFIVASYDTTGTTMLYTLVLLGSHQHVQERVYKELRELLGDKDENIGKHVLTNLVYLEAVLKESMRLYPPVPIVGKEAYQDVKLKNYTMPARTMGILSIYGVNRHPMWGADAEQFRPERWLEPGGVPAHPGAFASFGLGRRNCIGKQYALMSMKTTLAHLLRRYRVTADASKLILKWNLILRPVSGHDISLEYRK